MQTLFPRHFILKGYLGSSLKTFIQKQTFTSVIMGDKFNVVFVLGGPGSGKGTQCTKIMENFGYQHLSAGDLLRAERRDSNSEYGALIDQHIKEGSIVPHKITCALLKRAMENSGKKDFLIDGFPRNQNNLDGWNEVMTDSANIKLILFFNCSDAVCIDRCLKRGETSSRQDDNIVSLRKRIVTYNESTKMIIDYFKEKGLVKEILAEAGPSEVFEEVKTVFNEFMRGKQPNLVSFA